VASTALLRESVGILAGTLAARITAALVRFGQMRRARGPRIQIRIYDRYPTVSVVRRRQRDAGHAVPAVLHRQQLADL
jgi:hypothetical protein